ncbi:MAG: hypothetical protein AB8H86_33320 [Polyangiales bacterium]
MRFLSCIVVVLLCGCGSRTDLTVPEFERLGRPDICVELPAPEPPTFVDTRFVARIASADVLFLVDVTGSMVDEIRQIQTTLREVLVPGLNAEIPDVSLSVAEFGDYPTFPYGEDQDEPFRLHQQSTGDVATVQSGVGRLGRGFGGGDEPESHIEALWQSATGAGIPELLAPGTCAAGRVGYPCFREDGSRIILLFTDAPFHNGPGDSFPYTLGVSRPAPAGYDETVGALRTIGARVLGLYSGAGGVGLSHLRTIAEDTGAVTRDGEPIVVDIGEAGEDLGEGVIDVVRTLVQDVFLDIDLLVEDFPLDDVDAREFVVGIETLGARPATGATDLGDRYVDVRPGTEVAFRVNLDNTRFEAGPTPVSYFLTLVLRGDGVTRLRETIVEVVIPSTDGEGCAPLDG